MARKRKTKRKPKQKVKRKTSQKPRHPVSGLTEVEERARCKAAMRQVWRKTARVEYIRSVRFFHPDHNSRFMWAVECELCGAVFGQSEKVRYKSKTGRWRWTGAYHVDHICEEGMPAVQDLAEDLGTFALKLLRTPLRIVCVSCHSGITIEQAIKRNKRKSEGNEV